MDSGCACAQVPARHGKQAERVPLVIQLLFQDPACDLHADRALGDAGLSCRLLRARTIRRLLVRRLDENRGRLNIQLSKPTKTDALYETIFHFFI